MIDLHCGDCLEVMKGIEPGTVDAIITDLPYGTTVCAWDATLPFQPMWESVKHVLKPSGVFITTASQPFTSALVMSNPKWFKYEWLWIKTRPTGFLDANRKPLKQHENICVFYDKQPTYNPQGVVYEKSITVRTGKGRSPDTNGKTKQEFESKGRNYPRTVIEVASEGETRHPTQKPVALMSYLIQTYTNPGETVMDICMGSGTTGIACKQLQRNFIGIELDPHYFEIAKSRINTTQEMML